MSHPVLLVDDDQAMCEMLALGLAPLDFDAQWRTSAAAALDALDEADFAAIVTDLNMAGLDGIDFCRRIQAKRPALPVIVITAFGSMATAISALRAGAYDFINKPFEVEVLALSLERAIRHRDLEREVRRLREAATAAEHLDDLVGKSPSMRRLYDLIARVADTESSVLVVGETGTGKELIAHALHRNSRRAAKSFVAVNCAAMPPQLLESELFGHTKGAFTGASSSERGLFVRADGGTVFLDEIGELPIELQPKLLRALQERRARPVGGSAEVEFNIRLITATNRDLEAEVEAGRFREDLLFRINVINITAPPLRLRGNDILLLAQSFLEANAARMGKEVTGFTARAAEKLLSYSWPGNVRELQNCVERGVALTRLTEIVVDDLPERIRDYRSNHVLVTSADPRELVPMVEVERRYIQSVLEAVGGNKAHAARVLGFNRKTLYRKLERYGLAGP